MTEVYLLLGFIVFIIILVLKLLILAFQKSEFSGVLILLKCFLNTRIHSTFFMKGNTIFIDAFEKYVDSNPQRVFFVTAENGESFTLNCIDRLANQIANWGLMLNFTPKSTVAVMLGNHPDMIALWIGFGKIGVSSALINTNLSGTTFISSCETAFEYSSVKVLIIDIDLKNHLIKDIQKLEAQGISIFYWGSNQNSIKYKITQEYSIKRISKQYRNMVKKDDALLYIFTSGTTGMPKACKLTQTKLSIYGIPFSISCSINQNDKIYLVLPMYHSACCIGVCTALYSNSTIILRKKFSVSQFSFDCIRYKITHFQYIGELCRYLVNEKPNDLDKNVKIKYAIGNGLRPEIWAKFQERYNVGGIVEFYAATEGNVFLFNPTNRLGALGYIPRFLDRVYPTSLVRPDPADSSMPFRNDANRCELCAPGEVGLLVCEIQAKAGRGFAGYTDEVATQKKILKGLFKDNDSYFNTGDLLFRDADGFFYWSDRVGDTFRWKGENVSTAQVGEVLATLPWCRDVTVYGVAAADGRAGMAAVVPTEDAAVDLAELRAVCRNNLPSYASPIFLRIKPAAERLEVTVTFKHIRSALVAEVRSAIAFTALASTNPYLWK